MRYIVRPPTLSRYTTATILAAPCGQNSRARWGDPGGRTMQTCLSRLLPLMVAATLTLSACLPHEAGPPRSLSAPPDVGETTSAPVAASLGRLPLSFVENRGQLDPQVGYYAPARGTD